MNECTACTDVGVDAVPMSTSASVSFLTHTESTITARLGTIPLVDDVPVQGDSLCGDAMLHLGRPASRPIALQ